jgi:hypothetical protein
MEIIEIYKKRADSIFLLQFCLITVNPPRSMPISTRTTMTKILASICVLNVSLAVCAFASPGEDLLVSKLSPKFKTEVRVPQGPLVEATVESIKKDRALAPEITAAAVNRAEDCPSTEAVVRAALRQLAPTETALEVYAITRAAFGASGHKVTTNASGDRAIADNCNEGILTTAASEYPQFAEMLNNAGQSGKQLAGKGEPGIGASPESREPGIGAAPSLGPSIFPEAVILPSPGSGLVAAVTPTF